MTLSVRKIDGQDQYELLGVVRGNSDAAVPLGRRYFNVGAHWIGFDDNFAEPVIVRAYYDPTADNLAGQELTRGLDYLGYMQFMHLTFLGEPIPPAVYGGRLADRQPYVYGRDQRFIDFMGPADAAVRDALYPFYPFNGMLSTDDWRPRGPDDTDAPIRYFSAAGRPNGSLYMPGSLISDQSAVASLVAEIAPGLVTPADVSRLLTDANLVVRIPPTEAPSDAEPYRIALTYLKTRTPPEDDDEPWLADLDESAVAAQVIGDYALLTLPDPEDLGDTLVVYASGPDVLVHVLRQEDTVGMAANTGRDLLWRVRPYLSENAMIEQAPSGRGSHGLTTPPFLPPQDTFVFALNYRTIPVGYRQHSARRWTPLPGVEWAALFQFSQDTGLVTFAAIQEPIEVVFFDLLAGLTAYLQAVGQAQKDLQSKKPAQSIDISNFTKAAMRRDNFKAGRKLRFVDRRGANLPAILSRRGEQERDVMPGTADPRPVVTLSVSGSTLEASWAALQGAYAYDVQVTDSSGVIVYRTQILADGYAPPVSLGFAATPGQSYTVRVWVAGPPSDPVTTEIPDGAQILAQLRDRLLGARSQAGAAGYVYPLDEIVLPGGLTGDPAGVRTALGTALGDPALTVTSTADPALSADSLRLAGTSAALTGEPPADVLLVFTVSSGLSLQATWTATPPAGWNLADAFEVLANSGLAYLPLTGATFTATTSGHVRLQFHATLPVRGDLQPSADGADGQQVKVGGPVDVGADGRPQFSWTGEVAAGPFTIARVGQDALTMASGTLTLSSTRTADPAVNVNSLTITGPVLLGADPASPVTCVVDLPTVVSGELSLRAVNPSLSQPSAEVALTGLGAAGALGAAWPPSLLSLTGATLSGYSVVFDPAGTQPTRTTITLGFGTGTWPLVPTLDLAVADVELELTVIRAAGYRREPVISARVEVRGRLRLGDSSYPIRAGTLPQGPWYAEITGNGAMPGVTSLAGLTELTGDRITGVLPELPAPAAGQGFTPSRVALIFDPTAQQLRQVLFTISQTSPWTLLDELITVSGWTVDLAITNEPNGWTTAGSLSGSISLKAGGQSTTVQVQLPVPIDAGNHWTLALDPDTPVQLPTVGQVLALLGADPAVLPTGIATLGGLTLTRLAVSVNSSATTLQHLAVAFSQSGDWVIIPGALAVTRTSAAFGFRPGTGGVGVTGVITGVMVLCGTPVDVAGIKNDPAGGWTLQAAYGAPVHVPGWTALDAWLSPGLAGAALPDSLPLTHGFDVGAVLLEFADDGRLARFGFTVSVTDLWTVIRDYLALTRVRGQLIVPCPVTASEITGTVAAVLTIGGADIAITASKPDTGSAWEFTGTLLAGVTFDLVQAAGALTAEAELLPADAGTFGLRGSITIDSANVRAVPDTGLLHVDGQASFDWQFPLGPRSLVLTSIGGVVDVPERGAEVSASVTGTFSYAGIDAELTLALGGATAETVLTGTLTAAAAGEVRIGELADGIGAPDSTDTWSALVPADLGPLTFTEAAMYLNLTTSQLLLHGTMRCGTAPAAGQPPSAEAFVYLSPALAGGAWRYAVAVSIGPGFRFGDVLGTLARADDHIRVSGAHLVICDLHGGSLADLSRTTGDLLDQIAPDRPGSPPRPLDGLPGQTLSAGVLFLATIDFDPATLFGRILQIGNPDNPDNPDRTATVWLSALIDRDEPDHTAFAADLPDITFLDTITFTHTDIHPGIRLSYTPAQASRFELSGRMELDRIFGKDYRFDLTLTVDDTGLTGRIEQTGKEISQPFGIPGIVLSDLGLAVSATWTPRTTSFTLDGHVMLGPAPQPDQPDRRFSCDAGLVLLAGLLVLFDITLTQDFSIGAFLAQCLTGASWPSDFIEITFAAGTRIYYYDAVGDPGHAIGDGTLSDGFHIDATIRLTLVTTITMRGVVTVLRDHAGEYTGIEAGIALTDPLDLVVVQLAGSVPPPEGQPYAGGPQMAFNTGPAAAFALSSGINFLGSAFLAVNVGVKRVDGATVLTGTLTAARELAPFGTLGCGFSYTSHPDGDGELALSGWPDWEWALELVDFVAAIKELADTSDGSPCGQLADLIVNNIYSSHYSVTPSVSVDGGNLVFGIGGSYSLTFTGAQDPFVTVDIPEFKVRIPFTTRWDDLPGVLEHEVTAASAQFAQDLLDQPDKIALFLAMVVGPEAAKVALELACNGLVDGAVATATGQAVTVIANAGGVLAAGVAGVAAGVITGILASGGGDHRDGGGGVTVARPHFRTLTYHSTPEGSTLGQVEGTWDAAPGAGGYTFEMLQPDRSVLAQKDLGMTLSGRLPVDPIDPGSLPVGTYLGQVRGTRGQLASDWAKLPLDKAGPDVTLSYAEPDLIASWPEGAAASYVVRFFDPAGTQIGADMTVDDPAHQAWLPLPEPAAGAYGAAVQANVPGQFPGAFSPPGTLTVLGLAAPQIGGITRSGGDLTIRWAGFDSAIQYTVRVSGGGSTLASLTTAGSPATVTPSPALAAGQSVLVEVRARGENGLSPWASVTFTVRDVPAPASAELHDVADDLVAAWARVMVAGAPAAVYNLELAEGSALGTGVGPVIGGVAGTAGPTATLTQADGSRPAAGTWYAARVQADVGGNLGPWITSAPVLAVTLPPPSSVVLQAAATSLTLSWDPPTLPAPLTGPVSYDIALLQGGTIEVGSLTGITGTAASLTRSDHQAPVSGHVYSARIRAAITAHLSGWITAGAVRIMDVPTLTQSSYAGGYVSATWTPSAVPDAWYEIDLEPTMGGGPGFVTQVPSPGPGRPAPPSARISMDGRPRWTYTARVRTRSANSAGDWSSPAGFSVIDPPGDISVGFDGTSVTVSWTAVSGLVRSYLAAVAAPDGTGTAWQVDDPGPRLFTTVPAQAVVPGVDYRLTIRSFDGQAASAPSAAVHVMMPLPPAGLTASYDATQITVTWDSADGVTGYLVDIRGPEGEEAAGHTITRSGGVLPHTAQIPAAGLRPGGTYTITVRAQAGAIASAASEVPLTLLKGPLFTCLCLGTPPGEACEGADGADFATVLLDIEKDRLDALSLPSARTGWVAVPARPGADVAVLAQLTAKLAVKRVVSDDDGFAVFGRSRPSAVQDLASGGPFTCLCLGTTPGGDCGFNARSSDYSGVVLNVSQAALDASFHPDRTGRDRTGWVAVGTAAHVPSEVLLQLVMLLAKKGILTGTEPYDVFNNVLSVAIRAVGDGPTTCVALGAPVGAAPQAMGGRFGEVVTGVMAADLPGYQVGPGSGWASMDQYDYSVTSAILRLVTLLAQKHLLSGTEPYDVFGTAGALPVDGG